MPTIQYLDNTLHTHNLTSYTERDQAMHDLNKWLKVASSALKVSNNINLNSFRFINTDESGYNSNNNINNSNNSSHTIEALNQKWSAALKVEFLNRQQHLNQHSDTFPATLNIDTLSQKDEINIVQAENLTQDYLLLDLILIQHVVQAHGTQYLSDYGQALMQAVENNETQEFENISLNTHVVQHFLDNPLSQNIIDNNINNNNNNTHHLDNLYMRDVARVMKENNTIFLHSIGSFHPDENSPLKAGVSFDDKVNQIRVFKPSLSCSSFKLDNQSYIREFTDPVGVIINAGHIKSAHSTDAGTIANTQGERATQRLTTQDITDIINKRQNTYDEFALSNTEVSGLYCNFDRIEKTARPEEMATSFIANMNKIINYQKNNPGLPLFIIKNGNIHEVQPKMEFFEESAKLKKAHQSYRQFNSTYDNASLLEKTFIVSAIKNIHDIQHSNFDLSLDVKIEKSQNLIENYKPHYQTHLTHKLDSIKSKISHMREDLNNHNSTSKLKI